MCPHCVHPFSTLNGSSRLQDGDVQMLPPMFNRRQAEEWREFSFTHQCSEGTLTTIRSHHSLLPGPSGKEGEGVRAPAGGG